jgi:integrase
LLEDNPATVVSEFLGHASIAVTLGIYGHVLPNRQAQAVVALEGRLARAAAA